jgi:signal transduction histidine kinase
MGNLARQVLANADAERRRLERVLHDGAQQRFVAVTTTLALARRRLDAGDDGALELLDQASEEARRCLEDLRELARDIYPAVLAERGLASALNDLARRAPVPVQVDAPEGRFPEPVELAAYLVAAKAIERAADEVTIAVEAQPAELRLHVEGATLEDVELHDRVGALGGRLEVGRDSVSCQLSTVN